MTTAANQAASHNTLRCSMAKWECAIEVEVSPAIQPMLDQDCGPRNLFRRGPVFHEGKGGVAAREAGSIGSLRIRFPVAANTALATAGARGGTPVSPMPPGSRLLGTMCTSTSGASLIRRT